MGLALTTWCRGRCCEGVSNSCNGLICPGPRLIEIEEEDIMKRVWIVGLALLACFSLGMPSAEALDLNWFSKDTCWRFDNYPDTDFLQLSIKRDWLDWNGKSKNQVVAGVYQFASYNQYYKGGKDVPVKAVVSGALAWNGLDWRLPADSKKKAPVMTLVGSAYAEFFNAPYFKSVNLHIIFDDWRLKTGKVYGNVDLPDFDLTQGEPISICNCRDLP